MRFEVLKVVRIMMMLWVLAPCTLVYRYKLFGEIYYLHLQGWSSEAGRVIIFRKRKGRGRESSAFCSIHLHRVAVKYRGTSIFILNIWTVVPQARHISYHLVLSTFYEWVKLHSWQSPDFSSVSSHVSSRRLALIKCNRETQNRCNLYKSFNLNFCSESWEYNAPI
jgi:hypothetical protein